MSDNFLGIIQSRINALEQRVNSLSILMENIPSTKTLNKIQVVEEQRYKELLAEIESLKSRLLALEKR